MSGQVVCCHRQLVQRLTLVIQPSAYSHTTPSIHGHVDAAVQTSLHLSARHPDNTAWRRSPANNNTYTRQMCTWVMARSRLQIMYFFLVKRDRRSAHFMHTRGLNLQKYHAIYHKTYLKFIAKSTHDSDLDAQIYFSSEYRQLIYEHYLR